MLSSRLPAGLMAGIAIVFSCGCGDDLGRVPAGGVITFQGRPVENATVTFLAQSEGGVTGEARTGADGKFSVSSAGEKGIPPGTYGVAIVKIEGEGFEVEGGTPEEQQKAMMEMMMKGPSPAKQKNAIPEKYGKHSSSGLKAEVSDNSEKNQFTFDLK